MNEASIRYYQDIGEETQEAEEIKMGAIVPPYMTLYQKW